MKQITACLFLLLFLSSFLFSQTNENYSGVAQGKDLEKVKLSALQNLSQQIHLFVASKSSRELSENNKVFSDSLFTSTTTQSFLSLTDVKETVEKIDRETYKVTKSVSRANVERMFAQRRTKILDYIKEAERLMKESSAKQTIPLQAVIDNYYQAYLLSIIYPDTLTYYFSAQPATVTVGIPNVLSEIARSVEFVPVKQVEDDFIVWKFSVRYNGKNVSEFRYSYFDGMGQSDGVAQNGQTQITLYYDSKKEKKERQLQLQLEFLSADELDNTLSLVKKFSTTTVLNKTFTITIPGENKLQQKQGVPTLQIPASLQSLVNAKNSFEDVKNELDRLVKKGIIVQGRASDFETLNGLYCIVVDKPGLLALIKNSNNTYYDFLSAQNVELKNFSGKRILWFELLK